MVDIRERVEEDRGWIKKIQLHIPGYSGYRRREDIRAADNILRIQLSEKLGSARVEVEGCRNAAVDKALTNSLERFGGVINKFKAIEGRIRHGEQGYSGISPSIRVLEEQLDKLYEYDYSLATSITGINGSVEPLKKAVGSGNESQVTGELSKIESNLAAFEESFGRRLKLVTKTEV